MYLKQITFTRFLAAIWVVLFHRGNIFTNSNLFGFASKGNLGVSYFFVLSGYVMMLAYYNQDKPFSTKTYYLNRIARIYPLYLFAVILSILIHFLWLSKTFSFTDNALNILVLQAFFFPFSDTISEVFGVGWSLTTELMFYACFPFLLKKIYRNDSFTSLKVFVISFVAWIIYVGGSSVLQNLYDKDTRIHDFIFHFPVWHINQFLIGNFFGLLFIYYRDKSIKFPAEKYADIIIISLFVLLLILLKILPFWKNKYTFFPYAINVHNGALAYLFGAIMLVLSYNNGLLKKIFSLPFFILLGEISYAIYLFQEIAMSLWKIITQEMNLQLTQQWFMLSYVLFLIFFSYLAHKIIEKPCLQLLKKYY